MKLIIRVKNGQPFDHPIMESNFRQVFPDIDINNLPSKFVTFERVKKPTIDLYQVYEGTTYEILSGVCRDVHHIRDMTVQEILEKQNTVKSNWSKCGGYASWIFNEKTCSFHAPITYPSDGNLYIWEENSISWKKIEIDN